jgi:hypothetical protein
MFNRILFLLLGVCLSFFGFFTIIQRGYFSSRFEFYFDFGRYHYVFGVLITVVGIFFIYTSLTSKSKHLEDKYLICPKCKDSYNQKDVPNSRCPNCAVELEDLEGFYDRHPEPKEKGQDDM